MKVIDAMSHAEDMLVKWGQNLPVLVMAGKVCDLQSNFPVSVHVQQLGYWKTKCLEQVDI